METQKNISPDEESLPAKAKEINVSMLDSELVVSPPVVRDAPDMYSTMPAQADLHIKNPKSRQPLPANRVFMGLGLLALLGFVALGAFLIGSRYSSQEQSPAVSRPPSSDTTNITAVSQPSTEPQTVFKQNNDTEIDLQPVNPTVEESSSVVTKNPARTEIKREIQNTVYEKPEIEPIVKPDGKTEAELNASLNEWIDATNEKNVERQMTYYAPKLNSFYLWRGASINEVRGEKKRVFSGVDEVDIRAEKPQIVLSRDGKTAKMLFRKKYNIKKGDRDRSGEVLQEMKWVKTKNGWKIVGERDVKVLN